MAGPSTDWMHGYYAESGYSYGYYVETMPSRLRWASLLNGHILPEKNFRYLDAGCGQGLNLIMAAAMHPESEFVGIDFMPAHIAHARDLARKCGLDNVTLIEGDFMELARDPGRIGEFDMAIAHGISTWISEDVKRALFSMVGQVLLPGGVFYNSYNVLPGWLGMIPFQHLVLLEQRSKPGIEAINAARTTLDELEKCNKLLADSQPSLPLRLKGLESQDPSYLVQEYNNHFWRPVFVSEMMDQMTAVKLDFLGTATLADAFDSMFKPELRELLARQPSVFLREQMRDYALMQSFRRDLYVKGRRPAWEVEYTEALRSLRVMSCPLAIRPEGDEPYRIKASTAELSGKADYYNALLAKLDARPDGITIGELLDDENDANKKARIFETLSMMAHGGWVTPRLAEPNPRGPAISAVFANEISLGAPYRNAMMPATGCAVRIAETDWLLTKFMGEGVPRDQMPAKLLEALTRLRRQLAKEGKAVTDEGERTAMVDTMITEFMDKKLPYFKNVGFL